MDKCGKNPQSARRKLNYHTKCDKNCHKILSVSIPKNSKQRTEYLNGLNVYIKFLISWQCTIDVRGIHLLDLFVSIIYIAPVFQNAIYSVQIKNWSNKQYWKLNSR